MEENKTANNVCVRFSYVLAIYMRCLLLLVVAVAVFSVAFVQCNIFNTHIERITYMPHQMIQ